MGIESSLFSVAQKASTSTRQFLPNPFNFIKADGEVFNNSATVVMPFPIIRLITRTEKGSVVTETPSYSSEIRLYLSQKAISKSVSRTRKTPN